MQLFNLHFQFMLNWATARDYASISIHLKPSKVKNYPSETLCDTALRKLTTQVRLWTSAVCYWVALQPNVILQGDESNNLVSLIMGEEPANGWKRNQNSSPLHLYWSANNSCTSLTQKPINRRARWAFCNLQECQETA